MINNKLSEGDATKPWVAISEQIDTIQLTRISKLYTIPVENIKNYFDEYIDMFRTGPDTFIPWYKEQSWTCPLSFAPPYPHEVFPQLKVSSAWFYNHPAWEGKLQ